MDKGWKPTVAITVGYMTDPRPYALAVAMAGGVPLVVFPGQKDITLGSEVDSVVLAGGASVHPGRYGQEFDPSIKRSVDEARDRLEFSVLEIARRRNLPVLGICRGLQVINVFFGGTLHQNLAGAKMCIAGAHRPDEARNHLAHTVTPTEGRLKAVLGAHPIRVNSIHRQGVAILGDGLHITARADDGVVEGVETGDGQIVAVQWHPEELVGTHPHADAIFTDLIGRVMSSKQAF
ncbi:uncharacterized protein PV06_06186 [Exophiala oligosperma]|uniref:Uncharacterized protein n=2 Tax=Chaetothyriales TaxID=34395 RepID=A0A0D2DI23_9EURO|nr:uncharacterized protein PV06_06186 [Exophiala oligosperma]KAJ9633514.1 hypothetical protein H2204_006897 [Knufia peltigerae]KIW42658.1 hypothetical protein PV06_06186 [Exophiala oligosperma]